MSESDLLLITEMPGFAPQIGRLVSMMNYVRSTTLSDVAGLGLGELDYLHDSQSYSNYFKWFHVLGHEINHRGQIRWLRTHATRRPQ